MKDAKHPGCPQTVLGRTGLTVSRLGFGCIPLGGMERKAGADLLLLAMGQGITLVDTARIYGEAEAIVGEALAGDPGKAIITSKSIQRGADAIREDVAHSLKLLGLEHLDIYFTHQVDNAREMDEVLAPDGALAGLEAEREAGRIGFIGLSSHFPKTLSRAVGTGRFDVILGRFNTMMSDDDREVLRLATKQNVGVLSMKVFEGGFLDGSRDLLLRHAFTVDGVHSVLIGMDTPEQITMNLDAVTRCRPPTSRQRKRIERMAHRFVEASFCSACGYCAAVCPKGIPIPQIFDLLRRAQSYHADFGYYEGSGTGPFLRDVLDALDGCDQCGTCLDRCPNRLAIPERLAEAARAFRKHL